MLPKKNLQTQLQLASFISTIINLLKNTSICLQFLATLFGVAELNRLQTKILLTNFPINCIRAEHVYVCARFLLVDIDRQIM